MGTPFENAVESFNALSATARTSIVVLIAAQLLLAVAAVVVLLRTPEERLVFGKRWVWVLIIVFGEMLGPVAFLAFGRKPVAALDPLAAGEAPAAPPASGDAAGSHATRVADLLYGREPGSPAGPNPGDRP